MERNVLELVLDNLPKIFYPEQWFKVDLALSKTELLAMFIVDRYGEVIMSQIADYLNAPLSTTTGLVNRLVKGGYLQRERSESDRRIVTIRLTPEGNAIVASIKEIIGEYLTRVNTVLSKEERQALLKIFLKVIKALSQEDSPTTDSEAAKLKSIPIE